MGEKRERERERNVLEKEETEQIEDDKGLR